MKATTKKMAYQKLLRAIIGEPCPMITAEYIDALRAMMCELTAREARILGYRFGMFDGFEHTKEETARITCWARDATKFVAPQQIYHIECKAFRKLRHPKRAFLLPNYESILKDRKSGGF